MARIGDYVREQLWPYLVLHLDDDKLPSWEDGIEERRAPVRLVARAVFLDGPATTLFVLAAVAAQVLAWNRDPSFENIDKTLWVVNWFVSIAALGAPILMGS